jgi:hypothetical protein
MLQPGNAKIVVELDGCHIRTGILVPPAEVEAGLTKKRLRDYQPRSMSLLPYQLPMFLQHNR